jgi:tetratricopeptide (TPR) repeat protein
MCIFSQIRECDIPVFEDIWTNLAHTHMLLHRYNDASHLYQATLKALPKSLCVHRQVSSATHISDCLALAYFKSKQYEDSIRVILKAIHLAPHQLYIWQNLCFAKKHFAESLVKETATVQVLKDKPDKSEGKEAATQKSKDNAAEKPIRANVTSKELLQALSEMENVLRFCAYLKSAPDETTEVYRKDLCCNIPQYIQCDWVQFEAIKTFCDVSWGDI